MVQNNHIWHGSHDPRYYLHPPSNGHTYNAPRIKGFMECKMNGRNRMIAPMLQSWKRPLFLISKLQKKYKRRKIIRTNGTDSSNTDSHLLKRIQ